MNLKLNIIDKISSIQQNVFYFSKYKEGSSLWMDIYNHENYDPFHFKI